MFGSLGCSRCTGSLQRHVHVAVDDLGAQAVGGPPALQGPVGVPSGHGEQQGIDEHELHDRGAGQRVLRGRGDQDGLDAVGVAYEMLDAIHRTFDEGHATADVRDAEQLLSSLDAARQGLTKCD